MQNSFKRKSMESLSKSDRNLKHLQAVNTGNRFYEGALQEEETVFSR